MAVIVFNVFFLFFSLPFIKVFFFFYPSSEIKELKILLRLSPPETMVNNNNRRDSLHSLPEPTEFEVRKMHCLIIYIFYK